MRNRTNRNARFLLIGTFCFYMIVLMILLFGKASAVRTLNLTPLHTIGEYLSHDKPLALSNLLGNVAMFVPLGLYLPLLCPKTRAWKLLLWIPAASLLAECVQYAFALGAADIDDVLLNALGGAMGLGVLALLRRVCKERTEKIVAVTALIVGVLFVLIAACLWTGVFGIRIRIL